MKKILALLMALCMVFALCACGGQTNAPADNKPAQPDNAGGDAAPADNAAVEEDLGDTLVLYSSMTEADLNDAFSAFGTVNSARLVMDRDTGRAKGFGFVEMNDSAEAQKAIDGMNGTSHGGRALVVNEARPREERPSRGGFGGGNRRGGFRNSY